MKTATKFVAVKPLNPRSPDTKYVGEEPRWTVQPTEERFSTLTRAFNWYGYFYGKKDAKEMLCHYLEHNHRSKEATTFRSVPASAVRVTPGWACRMSLMGLELTEHEQCIVDEQIKNTNTLKYLTFHLLSIFSFGRQFGGVDNNLTNNSKINIFIF